MANKYNLAPTSNFTGAFVLSFILLWLRWPPYSSLTIPAVLYLRGLRTGCSSDEDTISPNICSSHFGFLLTSHLSEAHSACPVPFLVSFSSLACHHLSLSLILSPFSLTHTNTHTFTLIYLISVSSPPTLNGKLHKGRISVLFIVHR